jgi:hypothetical protein
MSTVAEYQLVQNLVDDWPVEWKMRSVSFERIAERAGVSLDAGRQALRQLKKKIQYKDLLLFSKATGSTSNTHVYRVAHLICFQKATGVKVNTHVFLRCENSLKEPPVATSALEQLGPRYAPLSSSTDTPSFLFLRSLSSARLPSLL